MTTPNASTATHHDPDTTLETAAVEAIGLTHSFGRRQVFTGLNLTVQRGESVAIMGRSGSGKSTLLSCLLGLITPQEGEVIVAGQRMRSLDRKARAAFRARTMGAVFQHGELVPALTAEENVALPALMNGNHERAIEKARSLLDALEVPADTRARDLSGGEIQRTALARSLIGDPLLVLADEPTGALDTELRTKAADILFSALDERNCALVLVTHDPSLAARAHHTFKLDQGVLLEV